jgi:peptidoglycan hydrolase-like protein with peptidoglycan-binding domain
MRFAAVALLASCLTLPVPTLMGSLTQPDRASAQTIQVAEAAKKGKTTPKATPKKGNLKEGGNANLPLVERIGIQLDLAFTGHYNGLINGEVNERTTTAIKSFQKSIGARETGVLAQPERAQLAANSKAVQERVGWAMVEDKVTGAQLGLPTKQVPNTARAGSGTRWSSAQGQVQIETFRIREPGTTLAAVAERQRAEPPNRKLEVNVARDDFFILSGLQGLKKFYVRAHIRDLEVRGITILYDQATQGIMDPVTVVMSSAFAPFSGTGLTDLMGPTRRKVEYGTGIVITAGGHVLTDRLLVEGCNVIQVSGLVSGLVSGFGDANPLAEDAASGLSLLRVFGVSGLAPAAIVHEGARAGDLTLVGIADPLLQAGGRAVTTTAGKLDSGGLQPSPQLGFAGAAALDAQGRFVGMVTLRTPLMAGMGALPPANIVPVDSIRRFLDAHYVAPATGRAGAEAAKASVARVMCVRR